MSIFLAIRGQNMVGCHHKFGHSFICLFYLNNDNNYCIVDSFNLIDI